MKHGVAAMTPSERLRPRMGRARVDYSGGLYVVRSGSVRMDPNVTPGERRFDRVMERIGIAAVWVVGIVGGWWALFEGSKLVYQFAFNHHIG